MASATRLLTSIAPTGTISLFADNVSSGIEPVFAFSYKRKILQPDGTRGARKCQRLCLRLFRAMFGEDAALPDYFVDAQTLTPADHLAVQAAAQHYIDSADLQDHQCPGRHFLRGFQGRLSRGLELGCKGCTTYRPNAVTGVGAAVSSARRSRAGAAMLPRSSRRRATPTARGGGVVYMTRPLDRPEELPGRTYKIRWPDSDHAFYITINDIEKDGRAPAVRGLHQLQEYGAYAWTLALTRMISAVFRRGGDVSFVVEELKAIFDPRGGQWMAAAMCLAAGRDRRSDRAPHDRYRLPS